MLEHRLVCRAEELETRRSPSLSSLQQSIHGKVCARPRMSNSFHSLIEAHICLSRRLRLTTQLPRFVRLQSPVSRCQSFSTQSKRSQELGNIDDSFANLQDPFDGPPSFSSNGSYQKDDITLPSDAVETKPQTYQGFYMRHPSLYSRRALGLTTLGRPAEVLRLQDAIPKPTEQKWWLMGPKGDENPNPTEPLTSSDIMERVTSERGLVSAARVKENIESLKQEWMSTLKQPDLPPPKSDCYELGRRMHDGFTFKQLLGYLNETKLAVSADLTDLNKPFLSAMLTRSEWTAGVTPFPGNTAKKFRTLSIHSRNQQGSGSGKQYTRVILAYETQRSKVPIKYVLVNKIMRQCWNIRPKEEVESVGEVDVQIPEPYLELINGHGSRTSPPP